MECIKIIECLGDFCSCDGWFDLPLLSPVGGEVAMHVRFNGMERRKSVTVLSGQNVTIPNVFNENYLYEVAFFKNGENVFGKWFSVRMVPCNKN